MSSYKICVYAISKNEEKFVDRWMDSVSEADLVVVTDTGSTDNTVERLRERGALVFEEKISPWRFDAARNKALEHLPPDTDICVSNDLDEVFVAGWRQKLEAAWKKEYTRAKYLFTWSFNADGSPNKRFFMEKIHRRHGFRWVRPVHEVLEYFGDDEDKTVFVEGLVLNHYPDPDKPRAQYLPLLELSVQENPLDDRAAFWLGREYFYYGMYGKCVETLKRHLELPTAKWDEERSASMRFIARCFEAQENFAEARKWLFRAVAECPRVREPYLALAWHGYGRENWPMVYAAVKKALGIFAYGGTYLSEPQSWGYQVYDLGAISAHRLGLPAEARVFAAEALRLNPGDERLRSNLTLIENEIGAAKNEKT